MKQLYEAYNRYGDYKILIETDNMNEASVLLYKYQQERGLDEMFRIVQVTKEECDCNKYDDYIYG